MASKRDPEATRAAILDAAEEAFLRQGPAEASTAGIAKKAGVTKSLIHHHFGSKKNLWNEVKVRRFSQYAEGQLAMLEQSEPSADLLRESMSMYFEFLQRNPQLLRLFAWMFLEEDEECADIEHQTLLKGVEALRRTQEAGEIRSDVDPRHLLMSFLFLVEHWFQSRGHLCRDLEMEGSQEELNSAYFADMVKIFFEGVLPR